jgi:hypothetical protein
LSDRAPSPTGSTVSRVFRRAQTPIASRLLTRPLLLLFCVSFANLTLHSVLAWHHSTPTFLPDEYIYAALGRSLGHGDFTIRGATAHFPAGLEPLLAAPIWRLFSTGTAYHLIQVENAVFMSAAAFPVYFLARRVGTGTGWSLACAIYTLALPSSTLVAYIMADSIAFPLALTALALGVAAIDHPRRNVQIAFVAVAALASLARIQYVALFAAYAAAALVVARRNVLREHVVLAATFAIAAVGIALAGPNRILGYYSGILNLHVGGAVARWFFLHLFFLSLEAGVVLVPGAVAALVSPRRRVEVAFSAFASAFALLLLIEAATYAANGTGRYKERYVIAILPLLPIAFGFYLRNRRPSRHLAVGIAAVVAIAAARLPLSQYSTSTFKSDSQFLFAVSYLQERLGAGNASLLIAVIATALAAAAALAIVRPYPAAALAAAIVLAAAASGAAAHMDLVTTRELRSHLPHPLGWVDAAAKGPVVAVVTAQSPMFDTEIQLFWNPSVQREVTLDGASPTDAFAASSARVGADGMLEGVRGDVMFDDFATAAAFQHAQLLRRAGGFSLWHTTGRPQFRWLIEGRFSDGWLTQSGRIRAWPLDRGASSRIAFRISLPRRWAVPRARLRIGSLELTIPAGGHADVECSGPAGELDVRYRARDLVFDDQFRRLSARMTRLVVGDVPHRSRPGAVCVRSA